jgi:hypothetical protein
MCPCLRWLSLRFLAIRSRFPNLFTMLSVYFNDSVYQFRHPFK